MSSTPNPNVLVPDEFRPHAKLVLIGEAPWKSEAERGYPFAGWSGLKLREMWGKVGLRREDFSILNVYGYPRKPETVKPDTMLQWVERLHKSLACHTDPYVLVPVGNLALWALTGKSYPPWDKPKKGEFARAGIQKLRGSVLTYNDRLGRKVKVVPSVHPAALARQPGLERACLHDWERVRAEMGFKEVRKIKRDLRVAETVEEVQWWVQEWMKKGETVTFDIENPSGKTIMIGFSSSSSSAVTVPTTPSYWKHEIACETVWRSLSCFLQSDVPKCGQNVSYDIESLYWERGIQVRNVLWDTANMYHCLDATEGKYDLAYLASVHTNEEFWKDEAKDPEESKKYTSNMQAFYRYNGLDAAVTHELYEKGRVKLQELGLERFYLEHYGYIQDSLVELATTGIQVNEAMRKWRWADLMAERFEVQDQLREVVGEDLCAKKSLSPTRLQRFLYESLRLPKKYKRVKGKEEKSVTTDESAILALMQEHPQVSKLQEAGKLILRLRFLDAREKYYTDKLTRGGRMYSKYSPRTEEGRLSSSASNQRTEEGKNIGMNAQNIDRKIRDMFVAG